MEIKYDRVFYDADDEEPDCGICDNLDCFGRCEKCGAEYGWRYYEREELDPAMVDLILKLQNLGAR